MDSEAPTNLQHKIPLTEQPTPVNSLVFSGTGAKLKTFISGNIQTRQISCQRRTTASYSEVNHQNLGHSEVGRVRLGQCFEKLHCGTPLLLFSI